MTAALRRWATLALAPLVAAAIAVAVPAAPAAAEPGGGTETDEGTQNATLNDVLEASSRRYQEAKSAVTRSTKTQLTLAIKVREAEETRDRLLPQVDAVADRQYRTGGLGSVGFMLDGTGSDDFVRRTISLEELNRVQDSTLRELNTAIKRVADTKAALDTEVRAQKQNLLAMQKQKESAEKALQLVGGRSLTGGFVAAKSPVAAPAPRDGNGDLPKESCSEDDPTTGGCVTPRTLHMYKEVKKAGFNRFVGCHRNGGPFEHPKGLACDWSLQKRGFSAAHNDDMRRYGNNLMAFLMRNADRLGIYYVIWYKQICFPAAGTGCWHSYSGPSDHTDHVHVSML